MGQSDRHLHSLLGCSLWSVSLSFSCLSLAQQQNTVEFNFQTFIHSCFIHIYCSCRIRMNACSVSKPLFFSLLRLTVSCNLSYELWISTLLEIFTLPAVMVLCCHTGLSLDACCWSHTVSYARHSAHKLTHEADIPFFSWNIWLVCMLFNSHIHISMYPRHIHRCQSTASHEIYRTHSVNKGLRWGRLHMSIRDNLHGPNIPLPPPDFLPSLNFWILTSSNPQWLK